MFWVSRINHNFYLTEKLLQKASKIMTSKLVHMGIYKFRGESYTAKNSYESKVKISKEAISTLIESSDIKDGSTYVTSFNDYKLMLLLHKDSIFIVITREDYPNRCMHAVLLELISLSEAKIVTAPSLKSLALKYDDIELVDKLMKVQNKVNVVTLTMQNNIDVALQNCVKAEKIESDTEVLMQQAGIFKDRSRDLKLKMWWQNMKMRIMIVGVALIILGIVIGLAVAMSQ